MKLVLIAAAAAAVASSLVSLPANAWDILGVTEAIDRQRDDRVDVRSGIRYSRIMFCAYDGQIRISGVDLTFGNDRSRSIDEDMHLNPGECTSPIDLPGRRDRHIDSIHVTHEVESRREDRALLAILAE